MNKNIRFLILTCIVVFTSSAFAQTLPDGKPSRDLIILSGTHQPRHLVEIDEPVAMYTISTATIDITFDANYYSEYTIHLVGEYVEMDYFSSIRRWSISPWQPSERLSTSTSRAMTAAATTEPSTIKDIIINRLYFNLI